MTALARTLFGISAIEGAGVETLKTIAMFGAGSLTAFLLVASYGVDTSLAFF